MRRRIFAVLSLIWFASGCCRTKSAEAWLVDSLDQVFPDDPAGSKALKEAKFAAARRSNVSLQLALRSSAGIGDLNVDALALAGPGIPIDRIEVRRVEYVVATTNTPSASRGVVLREAPALFPDALVTGFPMTVEKNKARSVWITIPVPADQAPGRYDGVLRLRQGNQELSRIPYTLDVTSAIVPEEIPFDVAHRFALNDAYSQQFYRTPQFSGQWWIITGNIARFLAAHHQTFIPANPMDLVTVSAGGGAPRYDFSNFVRFVRMFESAGVRGSIDGGQLLSRGARKSDPLTVRIWTVDGAAPQERRIAIDEAHARPFLASFYGELRRTLAANGWEKRYVQGLIDTSNERETEECKRWQAEIQRVMPATGFVSPAGVSGSFIDHPLLETRILGWTSFQRGERGVLRWEGNRWSPDPFKDTQPAMQDESTFPPPGGVHLAYPNREGRTLFSSVRFEQMRESVEDYALLVELSRKDAAKARSLAGRMASAGEPAAFRLILRELLGSF
ncbi:MAG: DUF4091 domain-containing protein [Acidobacteriales bacterium]|nr:DUF4091 domain-containing protein [Terriglobales bacterium]